MCAICFETLSNVVRAAVIASTGTVVCVSCADKFVRKDLKDPITGVAIKDKEIIALQSGGIFPLKSIIHSSFFPP